MMKANMEKQMSGSAKKPMRPRARPDDLMEGRRSADLKSSIRPIARPERDPSMSPDNPVGRGNRESMREAMEMPEMKKGGKVKKMKKMMGGGMAKKPKMKKMMGGGMAKSGYKAGGKVRGYGMARGGRACKMR